jgi:hypothetical protein
MCLSVFQVCVCMYVYSRGLCGVTWCGSMRMCVCVGCVRVCVRKREAVCVCVADGCASVTGSLCQCACVFLCVFMCVLQRSVQRRVLLASVCACVRVCMCPCMCMHACVSTFTWCVVMLTCLGFPNGRCHFSHDDNFDRMLVFTHAMNACSIPSNKKKLEHTDESPYCAI